MRESHGGRADHASESVLDHVVRSAVEELRAGVPVRDGWRTAVQDAIARDGITRGAIALDDDSRQVVSASAWTIRPAVAVAAAIACVVLGSLATLGTLRMVRTSRASDAGSMASRTAPSAVGSDVATVTPAALPTTADDATRVGVRFAVMAPGVRQVSLVGDFNGWDASATPLERGRDGTTWSILLPLATGRHTYAFVIDGAIVPDPAAPRALDDDFGTPSSFVLVSNGAR